MLSEANISRLLDIANAGCHKGCVADARSIYHAVLTEKPQLPAARIGMALSHIVVNEFDSAEQELNAVLERDANDADALAMLGLCFMLAGKKEEAEATLSPLAEQDSTQAQLARDLLEQVRA
jgi:thioredoxin-like negative regulator of GroEL